MKKNYKVRLLKEFKCLLSGYSDIGISEIKDLHNIEVFLTHRNPADPRTHRNSYETIYYLRVIFPDEYPLEQPKIYFQNPTIYNCPYIALDG